MVNDNYPWTSYAKTLVQGYKYIYDRQQGKVKSLVTPWNQFNNITLGGIEYHNFYLLSARPGIGKSMILLALTQDLHKLNPKNDFAILHLQFEMNQINFAARQFSRHTGLRMRKILSANDEKISNDELELLYKYILDNKNKLEFFIENTLTVNQIIAVVKSFAKFIQRPFIVTLDHTMLVKKDPSESNKQVTMENLSNAIIQTKKELPMTWIVLSQLNREIDSAERQIPGRLSNYPCEADIYMSDAFMQGADVAIAFNRPAKYNLSLYGPEPYILTPEDKYLIAAHVLKNRYGQLGIHWYNADYTTMNLIEREPPKKKGK